MENIKLKNYIEQTVLKPDITIKELDEFIDTAIKYEFLGICINPLYVAYAKEKLKGTDIKIVTVVGFPLGASRSDVKAFETKKAIEDGADEIDMVLDVCSMKDKAYDRALNDVKAVVETAKSIPVKVIFETDLLNKEEIEKACEICIKAGAKFVKTSTGFVKNGAGAKVDDVKLMSKIVKHHGLEVKASAGIRTKEDAIKMIEAGATRLGTSAGVMILES